MSDSNDGTEAVFFDGRWTTKAKDAAPKPDIASRIDTIEADVRALDQWATSERAGGAAGRSDDAAISDYTAAETISALRAVSVAGAGVVALASPTTIQGRLALGVSKNAAVSGAAVSVQTHGPLFNEGWQWTPGAAIYLGAYGQLTQLQPPGQFWQVTIGFALTPQSMIVRVLEPLLRASLG